MKQFTIELDFLRKAVFLHPPIKPFPPLAVHVNVGQQCNLDCVYCWRRDPDRAPANNSVQEKVGYDLKSLIDQLAEIGASTIEIAGGGEPLLFKDILGTMKYIKKMGLRGHLFTNGILFNEKNTEALIDMRWDFINFSLDAHSQDVFSRLKGSGKGSLSKVRTNVRRFAHMKKAKHLSSPSIRLSYIINRLNFNFIEEFIDLAISLSVNSIFFARFKQFPFNEELRLNEREEKVAMQIIDKNTGKLKKHNINVNSYFQSPNWPVRKFCVIPWFAPFITDDGVVHPCCCQLQKNMGDLKKNTFREIWEGEKYTQVRKRIRRQDWFKACKNCYLYIS
ncbi:MAG: radical SAM protein [Candidatus Omnitrophica bacterium]|nr:radical SAM protein [Candidatus Omnitrophota bacterium]